MSVTHQTGGNLARLEAPVTHGDEDDLAFARVQNRFGWDDQCIVLAPELDVHGREHAWLEAEIGVLELQPDSQRTRDVVQCRV